jgi:PIN domain nuclease of toxin-antitoxin system
VSVLDASALLAYVFKEPGADVVSKVVETACMSSVNLSEVLTRIARDGREPAGFAARIERSNLEVVPFIAKDALATANLEPQTRRFGLSLGDRACLALGLARREAVYTADRIWSQLDIGIKVVSIR